MLHVFCILRVNYFNNSTVNIDYLILLFGHVILLVSIFETHYTVTNIVGFTEGDSGHSVTA